MPVSSSGGGYLYGPFTSTQVIGPFDPISPSGVPATYGAWVHLAPTVLSGRGRWMEIQIWSQGYGGVYSVQLGIGALGSETPFQPSDGNGFYIDWEGDGPDYTLWNVPFRLAFPCSVPLNSEFTFRCYNDNAVITDLTALIYLWN